MPTPDEQLMRAFQAGRSEALEELFVRYKDRIWAFFRRRIDDPERARELAQDTFLALVQNSARYEPRASFRSYLFGIAFNVLTAARRRHATRAETALASHEPAATTADPDAVLAVREALASLDPDEREIVMMREYDALSYEEIATLTGAPVNTVRSRLFRARQALKARLCGAAETGVER